MTAEELQGLLLIELFLDRDSAISLLHAHPWLLIPDVRPEQLKQGLQGCYRDINLGENYCVDFVTCEIGDGHNHWQLTYIASPTDSILKDSWPSPEFTQALHQVELWRARIARGGTLFNQPFSDHSTQISFRIVIGQSRNQTPEEHREVQKYRRSDLRIRSFDWLIEKPSHYSDSEIATLEGCGPARSAVEFLQHIIDWRNTSVRSSDLCENNKTPRTISEKPQ